jgi:predicted RNA binding protein YcfA (HicA-like mRNA interferase family)
MRSVSGREFGKILERKGWTLLRVAGSHHHYGRGTDRVVIPVHGNRSLKLGLQRDLMKHAGLTEDDL